MNTELQKMGKGGGGSQKGLWGILLLGFVNLLVLLTAGIMLKEFPGEYVGGSQHVILRYDDYQLNRDNPGSSALEEAFFKYALANEIKMSVAVIPFGLSNEEGVSDKVDVTKTHLLMEGIRRNLFEICLHGYQHKNNAMGGSASEFGGVPFLSQRMWIERGKRKLESLTGAKVKVFVPPFNGWDQNTLAALRDHGFSILGAEAGDAPRADGFNFFPYTATPKEFEYLLANKSIANRKLIVLNIHPHDLLKDKNRIGLIKLEKILEEIKDPERRMELESFGGAVAKEIVFTGEELRYYSGMITRIRFWENLPVSGYLIGTKSLSANRPYYSSPVLDLLRIFMGVILLITGFLISRLIHEKVKGRMLFYVVTSSLVLALGLVIVKSYEYWNYGEVITGKRYGIIFLISGALIGLISATCGGKPKDYGNRIIPPISWVIPCPLKKRLMR